MSTPIDPNAPIAEQLPYTYPATGRYQQLPDYLQPHAYAARTIAEMERCVIAWQLEAMPDADPLLVACRFSGSYTRLDVLMTAYLRGVITFRKWLRELGREWSGYDMLAPWARYLRSDLRAMTRAQRDEMMTRQEREAFAKLPDMLTVYRGCYPFNERGLSWSLDRDVAVRFVTRLRRYAHPDQQAAVLTARVAKRHCVLKLDRNEQEIIAPCPRVRSREVIA